MKLTYTLPAGLTYRPYLIDLVENNHCVIAGSTGSGKSVLENNIIYALLCTHYPGNPTNLENKGCKFIFIDPKKVELDIYKNLPHTLYYADNMQDIEQVFVNLRAIIDNRLQTMKKQRVRKTQETTIYIFIDEIVDIVENKTYGKKIINMLVDCISISRAAGCFFVISSQAPNRRTLIPGIILNANCRVGLYCNSPIESRQIVGGNLACELPLHGKAVVNQDINRYYINIPMIYDNDIINIVRFWEKQKPKQHYF